jgi:3-hydroxyisobutyrate dehydrogenase
METIAFYGAGMLGSGMVRGMRRRGIGVRVWNRTFERAAALKSDGAHAFADAAEAARGAERLHLCLRDDAAVDAVLEAALPGVAPGTVIVDHTTVLPQRVPERAERLRAAGFAFMHAPVFMGPPMALESTGVMLSSGDATTLERLRPALEAMCSELRYLGEREDAAAIYKLMGNAMILAVVGGINDMLRMGEERGLTRAQAYELFDFYDPSGQIKGRGKRMAARDYEPLWTLEMAHKDAVLMQGAANHERLPVIDAIESLMRDAAARGLGDRDLAAVAARGPGKAS